MGAKALRLRTAAARAVPRERALSTYDKENQPWPSTFARFSAPSTTRS